MALAPQRLWIMPTKATDAPDGIAALVAQVLACRGIAVSEMAAFLAARPADAGPPMRDLDRAAPAWAWRCAWPSAGSVRIATRDGGANCSSSRRSRRWPTSFRYATRIAC